MTVPNITLDPENTTGTIKSRSLSQEAFRRLVRNRAAVCGGIIIIVIILIAVLADFIAPYTYDKQSLSEGNVVPTWLTNVFISMRPYAKIADRFPIGADSLGRFRAADSKAEIRCPAGNRYGRTARRGSGQCADPVTGRRAQAVCRSPA